MTADAALPLFDRGGWWDESCRAFASLRRTSAFRLDLLTDWFPGGFAGRTVVDLGCGGGLLAIPLAAQGARVVGVDLARSALAAGRERRQSGYLPLAGDMLRSPLAGASADLVLLADVLEHTSQPAAAVREAARLLRPSGHLFVNTIHRTWRSWLFAIALGEGLGFIPRGTHLWSMFVTPDALDSMASDAGLERVARTGEGPHLGRTIAARAVVLRRTASLAVGYAALYRRQAS